MLYTVWAPDFPPQTLYTGSSQFISGVCIWLQAKGVKPKSKPKVGSIWIEMHEFSSYTVALAHERQHGETQTKNPIRSPFHQLKCNHMAVYLHIHPNIWQVCIVWTLAGLILKGFAFTNRWGSLDYLICTHVVLLCHKATNHMLEMFACLVRILKILILCPRNSQ